MPDIPGVAELRSICENAARIIHFCELLGLEEAKEFLGEKIHFEGALEVPTHHHHGFDRDELGEDPEED